jgi:hypothetical protein
MNEHTKTPIEASEIRKGDLIRDESPSGLTPHRRALEYVALRDGHVYSAGFGPFYLLDRPTPTVELPSEPTLGWLDSTGNDHALGIWRPLALTGGPGLDNHYGDGHRALLPEITAFTPATAVPADSLDELRKIHLAREGCGEIKCGSHKDVARFLEAVDKAAQA